ncbi:MAG TPA: ElyC/SanA/YdcF family protein [Rariglobus sp.]|nr:ElyC/SanA/YdcF family protein [Rariglobus sp.]
MAFWLKKVVGFWLMPLPFSLALIIAGALLWRFSRFQRTARTCVITGGLWLLACSNVGVGTWLVRGLENQFPAQPAFAPATPPPADLARCRYIVVLGGGHTPVAAWSANNQLSTSALSRIVEGVRIARALPNATLIVTGPGDPDEPGPTHAHLYAEVAVSLGIPRDRIIEISDPRDTEQEAVAIHAISQSAPVALVTSAWHMPRSVALCRRAGFDPVACPSDFSARPPKLRFTDWISWNLGGLERSTKAIYERIGATWSRLRGKT